MVFWFFHILMSLLGVGYFIVSAFTELPSLWGFASVGEVYGIRT